MRAVTPADPTPQHPCPPQCVDSASAAESPTRAATQPDALPSMVRGATGAGDWERVATLARLYAGHSAFRLPVASNGHTALHLASHAGALDAVSSLLQAGAAIDAQDARRATPLHLAASRGHVHVVRVLLASNAALQRDDAGKTPLHAAAWAAHADVVAELLPRAQAQGVVDAVGADGRAALHCAGLSTDKAIADKLLDAGADTDLVDNEGRSALDGAASLALASGSKDVVDVLRAAGARSATQIGAAHRATDQHTS